jgi:hypothetical protein
MTLRVRRPGSAISPAGEIKPPPFDSPTRAKPIRMGSSGFARGNRSLSWIFYLWFAKLTIIKYLTRSTPHSGARTVVRLRAPSVRFPPSGQTKSPSVFTLGSFVCCPLGGSVRNNFSPSLENFHDPGSAISPAGEIKPPPFDSPTRAKQFARSSGHDKNTL